MNSAEPAQPSAHSASILRSGVAEMVACGAAALAYVATLGFGFVYDDTPQILKNPAIQAWSSVPRYFTEHVWAAIYPNSTGNYYRPLFLLWLRLNYAVFGTDAAGWHSTSIAGHVVATWLVFRLALKISSDRLIALVTALVFAVHPAHVENVAWISGATDPLLTCFVLASLLAYASFHESRRWSSAVLSLVFFAFALLAKETAVVVPVLIFFFALISPGGAGKQTVVETGGPEDESRAKRLSTAIRACIPYLLVLAIYVAVRLRALGKWSRASALVSWREVVLTWPAVLWFYAKHLVWPLRESEFYALDYVSHVGGKLVLRPLVMLVIAAALLLWLLRHVARKDVAWFAVVLVIVPLLPVLDLRSLTAGDIVHDRYLYLPSIGFAILVGLAIREIERRTSGRWRIVQAGITAAIVLGYASLTIADEMQWSNDIALYTRGLESAPANLTVRDNLANALLAAGKPERAIPLYLEVLHRNPSFWRSNYNLGFAYYKTGNFTGAETYLQRAIAIDPKDSDQYIYLALAELQRRKLAEAATSAHAALERNPQARGYHFVLGLIYEAEEDREQAKEEFRSEMNLHPDNSTAAAELQKLEANQIPAKP
jgi:protein O-mannosyl-transferase